MFRKPLVIAAVSVALLGLASCATSPGTAAYVGDHRITDTQIQDATAEVVEAARRASSVPADPADTNRRQVNRLVSGHLVEVEAERRGVSVSDAEVDALLRQAAGAVDRDTFADQLAAGQAVPPSELESFARTVALNQKLLAAIAPGADEDTAAAAVVAALGELSTELDTRVSPRFGTWNPAEVSIALPPDDLSTPRPLSTEITTGTVESN